jgi:glutamate-1-semialdehyde aminotransferase
MTTKGHSREAPGDSTSPMRDDGRFRRSRELGARLRQLVPGGAHTYAKVDDQFPQLSPGVITRGSGCHVWDIDGNEFIEYGMGLRAVTLGHAYPPVIDAVARSLRARVRRGLPRRHPGGRHGEVHQGRIDRGPDAQPSQHYRTLFLQEVIERGVIAPSFVVSYSHSDNDIDQTIDAVDGALEIYARALQDGVGRYLVGPASRPVFGRR